MAPVAGSPFPAGSGPASVAVSRDTVFVSNQFSGDISTYRIAAGGTLIANGAATPVGGNPTSIAVDPSGTYVYVANQSQVIALNITPNGPYALTYLRAYNAGTQPSFVAVDPTGTYVYVTNTVSNDVSGFSISAGGTLIPAGSASTTGAAGSRVLSVGHIGDPTAISLAPGSPSPPSGSTFGSAVAITGTVRDILKPASVPAGSIAVQVNGKSLPGATVALSSTGTFRVVLDGSTQYLPVGSNVLQLSYAPSPGFEAPAPLRLVYSIAPAVPLVTVSTSSRPAVGEPMTVTAALQQVGGKSPSGLIRILLDGQQVGNPVTLASGTASSSIVPSAGAHSLSASYAGDGNFTPCNSTQLTFTARYTTALAITANAASYVYGSAALLTAAVTSASRSIGGTLDVFDNGTRINGSPWPMNGSQALLQAALLSPGSHHVTAQFSGDTNNYPSDTFAAPLTVTVNRALPQVAVPRLLAVITDATLTFSTEITSSTAAAALPSGSVMLLDGAKTVATAALVNGSATLSVGGLSAGAHSLSVSYIGDSNYASASSAPLSITIPKTNPQLTVTTAPASPVVGQPVTVTTRLSGRFPVTGTVSYVDSGVQLSSVAVSTETGTATFTFAPNASGTRSITALYSGDSNYVAASAAAPPLVVSPAGTTVALVSSGALTLGQPLTLRATVSVQPPGNGVLSGTIDFRDGSALLGTVPVSAGAASFVTQLTSAGYHALSAFYSGDVNFLASASVPVTISEAQALAIPKLTASQSRSATVLTLSLTGAGGLLPTGIVTFLLGSSTVGTAPLVPQGGNAIASLTVGVVSGTLTAIYPGDDKFQPSSPPPVTISPLPKIGLSLSMNLSPAELINGQPFICTVSLQGPIEVGVTGVVALLDGGVSISSARANPQSVMMVSLSAGNHTLTATYPGDDNYLPASTSVTVSVNRATPGLVLSSDRGSVVTGQNISFIASVVQPTGIILAAPSGNVQFLDGSTVIASGLLANGVAVVSSSTLQPGTHQITAIYSGDSRWQTVRSNVVTPTIVKARTAVVIGSVNNSDGPVLSANVTVVVPGAGMPTGTVDFVDSISGQIVAHGALSGGSVTIPAPADLGSRTLVAVYRGDNGFEGSNSGPETGIAVVNAATFGGGILAAGEIATVFARGLVTDAIQAAWPAVPGPLGGVTVNFTDNLGRAHTSSLLYASSGQLSLVVPSDVPSGLVTMNLTTDGGQCFSLLVPVGIVSPGLFAANANGQGAAAAQTIRVHPDGTQDPPENTAMYDPVAGLWSPAPIAPASSGDTLYLVLYATGIRNHSRPVMVWLNGTLYAASFAGAQPTFPGLDQINVQLPGVLQAGDLSASLAVDGTVSNAVSISFASSSNSYRADISRD